MKTRNSVFAVSLLAVLFCALPLLGAEKPNVILIMADDIAYDNVGCYGSEYFKTPRLDELATTGAKFNHCYSMPLCTPSRVKIMTGRDNIRNYIGFGKLDKNETTFGTMLKNAGYATAVAGKWQLSQGAKGSLAPDCGFDTYCLWHYPGTNRQRYWNPSIMRDGKLVPVTADSYGPDVCTDFIIEFIERHQQNPFFVYYPMILVHGPFPSTPDNKGRDSTSKAANYRDMVAYMDKCVGRIVDALDKNGVRENTVVMFTTDNGTGGGISYPFKGEERNGEKGRATDGGSHAPLIVNCPGLVPAGTVTDDLVDFSDFLPTFAEVGGAKLPNVTLDGRSFWPQCLGNKGNPREWIFQYYSPKGKPGPIIWAQDQNHKFYSHGKFIEVADRHEKTDILPGTGSESAEAARRKLQAAIDTTLKSTPLMSQEAKSDEEKSGRGRRKKRKIEGLVP